MSEFWIPVFQGVLSNLIWSLMLLTGAGLILFWRYRNVFTLWRKPILSGRHEMLVVMSSRHDEANRPRPGGSEMYGMLRIFGFFAELIPKFAAGARFRPPVLSRKLTTAEFDANQFIVLLGGPNHNEWSKYYLDCLKGHGLPWKFEKPDGITNRIVSIQSGSVISYDPTYGTGDDSTFKTYVDYGLVIRGPHPHQPEGTVLVMAGAHGAGTQGAVIATLSSPQCKTILDAAGKHQFFAAVISISVRDFTLSKPNVVNVFPLSSRPLQDCLPIP